ncbi:hypothetical protein QYE76_050379 [Lolium multiflorum]|uniref:F-box domain-containing protein n=1 Tax=Lolium multiflorum TaxID=4521 RepID=A0AAD8SQZ8_LOLMU|nr:hypothetical protein QYE76_050379 [Lolium multiflorum]
MARRKLGPARISWRPKRRTVLVASLLLQNPTAAVEAVRPGGVTTRARSRRIAAAAAALPEEILVWEILVRLPAKDLFRCRTVCRSWRRITSAPGFLHAHHRRQPSVPLVTLYGADMNGGGSQIFKHGRPILGLMTMKTSSCCLPPAMGSYCSPSLAADSASVTLPRGRALHSRASPPP